jgi:hypothetical protein
VPLLQTGPSIPALSYNNPHVGIIPPASAAGLTKTAASVIVALSLTEEQTMPEPTKRDPKAPKFIEITVKDPEGRAWGAFYAHEKDFSTGSVGFSASEKIINPESGERYQSSLNFTLIGSKPGK